MIFHSMNHLIEKEPTNIASSSDHKLFFHSNKDPFNDIMTILRVGKLVTANELTWIQQKYNEDKKNVLRILQNFLIKLASFIFYN